MLLQDHVNPNYADTFISNNFVLFIAFFQSRCIYYNFLVSIKINFMN